MELILSEIVIPVLTIVLIAIATVVADKIRKKTELEIEDKAIEQAIHWVEEQSRKALARNGDKIPSNEKLDMAIQFVWDAISTVKKESYQKKLKAKIESAVNRYLHND